MLYPLSYGGEAAILPESRAGLAHSDEASRPLRTHSST